MHSFFTFLSSSIEPVPQLQNEVLLQEENQTLRHRLSEYATNEEIYRKKLLEHEQETSELKEKYEQKYFSLRFEYETKIEQLTMKTSEQQMEIFTLKQMYDTISEEKSHADERSNNLRFNEQRLQEKLEKLQMEYDQLFKSNRKPLMMNGITQTVRSINAEGFQTSSFLLQEIPQEIEELNDQLKRLQTHCNERERIHSHERTQYEQRIAEVSKRPIMTCVNLQTVNSFLSLHLLRFIPTV